MRCSLHFRYQKGFIVPDRNTWPRASEEEYDAHMVKYMMLTRDEANWKLYMVS